MIHGRTAISLKRRISCVASLISISLGQSGRCDIVLSWWQHHHHSVHNCFRSTSVLLLINVISYSRREGCVLVHRFGNCELLAKPRGPGAPWAVLAVNETPPAPLRYECIKRRLNDSASQKYAPDLRADPSLADPIILFSSTFPLLSNRPRPIWQ